MESRIESAASLVFGAYAALHSCGWTTSSVLSSTCEKTTNEWL